MKRGIAILGVVVLMLTACGSEDNQGGQATSPPGQEKQYEEVNMAVLPEESMHEEDLLLANDLQINQQGEPALYQFVEETDDAGDEFAAIMEYSLNSDGNWNTKVIGKKDILKRVKNETQHNLEFPFIQRGDDGNLYMLVKSFDEDDFGPMGGGDGEKAYCAYSVMAIDEGNDTLQEVKLQTKATNDAGEEIDYAREFDVTNFHVREDGTFMLVFSGSAALWFDGTTGTQTNVCTTIADSAFGKNVAYGESQILYFSGSSKLFGILDSDTLEQVSEFGKEIPEENRKYDWYFDTDTTTWQTYAFNQSGLYRISDYGKKASATLLSSQGDFDNLANADLYDILVGANEELYVLVRRPIQDDASSDLSWEFGVIKYQVEQ